MSDYQVPIAGCLRQYVKSSTISKDRFLFREDIGVKRLIAGVRAYSDSDSGSTALVLHKTYDITFPQIGNSLPCTINVKDLYYYPSAFTYQIESAPWISHYEFQIAVLEYGGRADPNYFNITGVDEEGKVVYDSEDEAG